MPIDQRYLEKHGGKFRVRVKVPHKARAVLGKSKLTHPLGTDSLTEANRHKWAHVARLKAMITNALKPGALPPDPLIKSALAFRKLDQAEKDMAFHGLYEYHSGGVSIEEFEEYGIPEPPELRQFAAIALNHATPFEPFIDDWITESKYAPRTEAKRRQAVAELRQWLKRQGLSETIEGVDKKVAARFKQDRFTKKGVHWATANSLLGGLRRFWKWMADNGHFEGDNPWSGLSLKKVRGPKKDRERAFTDAEMVRLFVGDPSKPLHRNRERLFPCMALGALSSGSREELLKMKVRDCIRQPNDIAQILKRLAVPGKECPNGVFYFPISKNNNRERVVPIHSELIPLIKRLIANKSPDEYLLADKANFARSKKTTRSAATPRGNATGQVFGRYRQTMGVHEKIPGDRRSKVNFHSFKRWFISTAETALDRGAIGFSPYTIASCAGHSREDMPLGMTMGRYALGGEIEARVACVNAIQLPPEALAAFRQYLATIAKPE